MLLVDCCVCCAVQPEVGDSIVIELSSNMQRYHHHCRMHELYQTMLCFSLLCFLLSRCLIDAATVVVAIAIASVSSPSGSYMTYTHIHNLHQIKFKTSLKSFLTHSPCPLRHSCTAHRCSQCFRSCTDDDDAAARNHLTMTFS